MGFKRFLLNEALYDIDEDVDLIMERHVVPAIKKFFADQEKHLKAYKNTGKVFLDYLDSSKLVSEWGTEAHKVNPIEITIGIVRDKDSFYDGEKHIHYQLLPSWELDQGKTYDKKEAFHKMRDIYDDMRMTVAHELAHWLNDSLENDAVKRYLDKVTKEYEDRDTEDRDKKIMASDVEIQGYMHDVGELKREYSEEDWDKLTFEQLFTKSGLDRASDNLKTNPSQHKAWLKKVMSRLSREGLVGKNMSSSEFSEL